jgi:nucleotide-binding universal stress UspA family protein
VEKVCPDCHQVPSDAPRPPRILLATDGSDDALAAARTLASMGLPPDSEITLLGVVPPPRVLFTPRVPLAYRAELRQAVRDDNARELAQVKEALHRTKAVLESAGLRTSLAVQQGPPCQEVLRLARVLGADLLVIGGGRSGLLRRSLGHVCRRVVRAAPCAVLMVRAGGDVR